MGGACDTYGEQEKCIQGFGGETLEKRPLGRSESRWEDDSKMDLEAM